MFKKTITAVSFVLGGAGWALVGYLETHPLAFTQPAAELAPASAPAVSNLAATEARANVIVVSEVMITPSRRGARSFEPGTSAGPCGSWTEVGALYVAPGGATGVRSVRGLCP